MKAPSLVSGSPTIQFYRDTAACLARGLTLEENHRGDIKRQLGVDPVSMPWDLSVSYATVPAEVRVLSAAQRDGDGTRTSGNRVTWQWVPAGGVRITAIEGLSNGTTYDLVLWIGGG